MVDIPIMLPLYDQNDTMYPVLLAFGELTSH